MHLHCKNESDASRPITVVANGERFSVFRDRFHNDDRNVGESKLIPLSTELRLIRRPDNKLVIVGKFDEADEIGELLAFRMSKKSSHRSPCVIVHF